MALYDDTIMKFLIASLTQQPGGASEVAEAVDVDRSRVTRWKRGGKADPRNLTKVSGLFYIMRRLHEIYDADTADKWLTGLNAHLGHRRPLDLLKQGRVADVLAAIDQTMSDSYA